MSASTRIVIADDSLIIRAGLCQIFAADPSLAVVGEATEAEELHRLVAHERPDVAIVDIRMPPAHTDEGIRAAKRIRRDHPAVAVLVLSQYVETAYAIELLENGSTHVGYLLKDRVMERSVLVGALTRVCDGETVVDSALIQSLMTASSVPTGLAKLSERELSVLSLLAQGLTDRGIAERIGVSPRTVGAHIQHIFDRLDIGCSANDNRRVLAVLAYLNAK